MKITINDEACEVCEIDDEYYLTCVTLDDDREFVIAESSEVASEAARKYWEDMAHDDPREFTCIVGEKNLLPWCLGQWAGPGTTQVNSLDKWLDLWLDTPEEQWASYDNEEREFEADEELDALLGFEVGVAYRRN